MKSQLSQLDGRDAVVSTIQTSVRIEEAKFADTVEIIDAWRDVLVRARSYAAGSVQRAALQQEFDALVARADTTGGPTGAIDSGWGLWTSTPGVAATPATPTATGGHQVGAVGGTYGVQATSQDTELSGKTFFIHPFVFGWASSHTWLDVNGTFFRSLNLSTMSAADFAAADTVLDWQRQSVAATTAQNGRDLQLLASIGDRTTTQRASLDTAIGALTDADLGKASANLRQAETRQQLANATVRQAISAYGNYAGGLLGNVQRTQRGISA